MRASQPTILLYDIDGTLISSGGAGRRALERAFLVETGRKDACDHFSFAGMTDRAIARLGLFAVGRQATEAEIDSVLATYVRLLAEEVRVAEGYRIHKGIEQSLAEALSRPGYAVGLGTGNVVDGARVKLDRVGLYERFSFGGFGSDAEDRAELIRIGAERGARSLGVPRAACRVVVIGDTPKDIEAAQKNGAESIGVGTGQYRPEELRERGASYAFTDLEEAGALDALLGSFA